MSTVANYVGRTVDLLAFHEPVANKEVLIEQILVPDGERGSVIAGIAKLAQRWLIEFLTIRGSIPALPTRGSRFIDDIRRGIIRTSLDAEQSFHLSAKQVATTLKLEEEAGIPADEAYSEIELVSAIATGDTIVVNAILTSEAGSQHELLLPIDVTLL